MKALPELEVTSSFKINKISDLKYTEEDIINNALPAWADLGLSPIYFINYSVPDGFMPRLNIDFPKYDSSSPHMKIAALRLTETSTKGTSTNIYDVFPVGWDGQRTGYISIDYSNRAPELEQDSIDVKVDYIDWDGDEVWEEISPSYTVIPQSSKLEDVSFRYADFGNVYLKTIVCNFNRNSYESVLSTIKNVVSTSATIAYQFELIKAAAQDFGSNKSWGFKAGWKDTNKILGNTQIVDFAYQGLNSSNDYLRADGDSSTHDLFSGNSGNDTIICRRGRDVAHGGKGDDILRLGNGADIGHGGEGKDEIHGGFGKNTIYNMADNDMDLITFKSDEWASNYMYNDTRGNQDGSKIDNIIGGDSVDKYRIIYDDDVRPVFTYTNNLSLEVSGISYKGTAIYLDGTLEAYVLDNGNLSSFSHTVDGYACVEFFFGGTI